MNKQEAAQLIFLMGGNYPNFPEKGKEEVITQLWAMEFEDVPFDMMKLAARKHMNTSVYPPKIKDFREILNHMTTTQRLTADEAWGSFTKAVSKYGYYRKKEALNSLDEVTGSIIDAMGFEYLCQSSDIMADRSHFLKAYKSRIDRLEENAMLPNALKHRIESVRGERLAIE